MYGFRFRRHHVPIALSFYCEFHFHSVLIGHC